MVNVYLRGDGSPLLRSGLTKARAPLPESSTACR